MAGKLFCLCLLLVGFSLISAKEQKCLESASNCDECLLSGPECAWCAVPLSKSRCHSVEGLRTSGCQVKDIYNPRGRVRIVQNDSSTEPGNSAALFLQPQDFLLVLRPGVSQSFNVTITMPTDQPITELNLDTSPVPEGINITFSSTAKENPFDIQVNIEATKCPIGRDDSKRNRGRTGPRFVNITPRGYSQSVKLRIIVPCECDCYSNREENSTSCGGHGSFMCGECECNEPYTGLSCEIDTSNSLCRSAPNAPVCSGRGQCVEEKFCECDKRVNPAERYSGRYCECSNFDCSIRNGRLCGGHGKCECGLCVCDPGWTDYDCSCTTDTSPCITANQTICNGRGMCGCGACACDYPYEGRTCQLCRICGNPCSDYSGCAECLAFQKGPKKDTCEQDCGHLTFRKTRKFYESYQEGTIHCKMRNNEDDCYFYYTLTETDSADYSVDVVDSRDCPSPF